jgi:hypothetical protein
MKTFAHPDEDGNVLALVTVSGPKAAMLTPRAGQFVTQNRLGGNRSAEDGHRRDPENSGRDEDPSAAILRLEGNIAGTSEIPATSLDT